ncbi:NMRL1 protein, partial [Chloroceryle aenea]|nr:NMRL1 protein [Chloroceryle aenea]
GAEVAKADRDDEPLLELALAGAYGASIVNNFWEHCSKGKEIAEVPARALNGTTCGVAWEGAELGLLLLVVLCSWSSGTRMRCGKGVVEEYFQKPGVPTMTIQLPFYFENFLSVFKPQKVPQEPPFSVLTEINLSHAELPLADTPVDGMAVEDVRPVVLALLKSPEEYIGQAIGLSTVKLTETENATVLSQQTSTMMEASKISPEEYERCGFPGAKELAAMFCVYAQARPQCDPDPQVCTFHQCVAGNKAAF